MAVSTASLSVLSSTEHILLSFSDGLCAQCFPPSLPPSVHLHQRLSPEHLCPWSGGAGREGEGVSWRGRLQVWTDENQICSCGIPCLSWTEGEGGREGEREGGKEGGREGGKEGKLTPNISPPGGYQVCPICRGQQEGYG